MLDPFPSRGPLRWFWMAACFVTLVPWGLWNYLKDWFRGK